MQERERESKREGEREREREPELNLHVHVCLRCEVVKKVTGRSKWKSQRFCQDWRARMKILPVMRREEKKSDSKVEQLSPSSSIV